jgi:hypothetical protein
VQWNVTNSKFSYLGINKGLLPCDELTIRRGLLSFRLMGGRCGGDCGVGGSGSVEGVEQLDKGAGELRALLGAELGLVGARAVELGQGLGVCQALQHAVHEARVPQVGQPPSSSSLHLLSLAKCNKKLERKQKEM